MIIYDPLEEMGGYKRGAYFDSVNTKTMCAYGGFTEGTILEDKHGTELIYSNGKLTERTEKTVVQLSMPI